MKIHHSRTITDPKTDPPTYIPHTLRYQIEKRPSERGPALDAWKAARKAARKEYWS